MNSIIQCYRNRKTRATLAILTLSWVALCLGGCGGNDGRVAVTGTVSVDGQPMESGSISFRPVDTNAAPSSGGAVVKGRFKLPADKGAMPGKYDVAISAFKPTGGKFLLGTPEVVPIRFNEAGHLEATIVAGEDNRFTFSLTTAK